MASVIWPVISEVARWVADVEQQATYDPSTGTYTAIDYTVDRYDPLTDTAELPLEGGATVGETLILMALFTDPYGHINRPRFTRPTEYIEDIWGVDGFGNPELQPWEYDQEIPTINQAGLEHWSFRPSVDLPDGFVIRVRGARAVHILKADQLIHRQGFPVVNPDHPHDHPDYPPDLKLYTVDREMQVLPVVAIGSFMFQVGQFGFWPYYSAVPNEEFTLDPENTAFPVIRGQWDVRVNERLSDRVRWGVHSGYRFLTKPETQLGDTEHFSGTLTTLQQFNYSNVWGGFAGVQFYTIEVRYSGLGLDAVQLASTGWLVRAKQWGGVVTVERSLDAGVTWPVELAREITQSAAEDSIPTLMRNHHDELFVWWHDSDGNSHADRSTTLGETWEVHTTRPGQIFPRAVQHLGRTLLFLHDGDTTLSIYGNEGWGLDADTLLAEFTLPPQLIQARVFRTRDGKDELVHVLAQAAIPGPIAYRYSKDGAEWSPSSQIVVGDAAFPGYGVGLRAGFVSFSGDGEYTLGRTTETYDEVDEFVELPPASLAPNQHLALLPDLADDLYLLAWNTDDPPAILTFFSDDEGRSWQSPA